MARSVTIAAAQMGPIARTENRSSVVQRLIDWMRQGYGVMVARSGPLAP